MLNDWTGGNENYITFTVLLILGNYSKFLFYYWMRNPRKCSNNGVNNSILK
jgi:hypothetical protein